MTISIKDGAGASKSLATGSGDGSGTPFKSPVAEAVGAQADAAASSDTGTFSVVAFIKRALQNWTTLLARIPVLGQQVAGSSLPVVLPAAQITTLTPVSTVTANLGTLNGAATSTKQDTSNTSLASIDGKLTAVALKDIGAGEYETVAASQSDQVLGATGATGDYLAGVLIVPATTAPGAVSIKDGGGSAITVFTGGASSVSNLVPFFVPLGIYSTGGAWKVTTGTNVSVIGVGNFT